MYDADVRAAVREMLNAHHAGDPETLIVEEMGIWSGSVRIDVAVINGELHGYELKSARDTLERLSGQSKLYGQVFDQVTLVAAEKHIGKAARKVPRWWGLMTACVEGNTVVLREKRAPGRNPGIKPLQLARLLWRSEMLVIMKRRNLDRGFRSANVEKLARRLAESLSIIELSDEVRAALKAREGWLRQDGRYHL